MKQLKILVVDDEDRMRKLVRDFLVRKQYEVVEASNGEEAVDVFVESNDIDLIILDVMMPKMDGWEACREIRKISKVPIIMLTAKSEESDELLGFELGVDEYISKPFSPRILVASNGTFTLELPVKQLSSMNMTGRLTGIAIGEVNYDGTLSGDLSDGTAVLTLKNLPASVLTGSDSSKALAVTCSIKMDTILLGDIATSAKMSIWVER